jgi:NADPH:quinone reductase-like Zn-dependent oxidoreductase
VLNLAPVGPEGLGPLAARVRPGGVCVTTVPVGPTTSEGGVEVVSMFVRSEASQLADLVAMVDDGRLQVWVDQTLHLADLASVHARSATGSLHGKVVLVP